MSKFDDATFRWACTMLSGLVVTPLHFLGVWSARRNALEVNDIVLTPWWYLFALLGPLLSIATTMLIPRSSWIWQNSLLFNILAILTLASFAQIPLMYSAGGFQ